MAGHGCRALFSIFLLTASAAVAQDGADPLFRQVRKAVSEENTAELHRLAALDPWEFREVVNRLADLALGQTLGEDEKDVTGGFNRFLVAGMLAGVYLDETGDTSLADRLRAMRAWSPKDLEERQRVQELLASATRDAAPAPRPLEKAIPVCRRLQDDRCLGMIHGVLGNMLERRGHLDAAAMNYEHAALAFRAAGELPRLRDALLSRGQLLLGAERHTPAAVDLGAAAAVAERLGDLAARAGSLLLLAQAQVARGERQLALRALTEARDTALEGDLPVLAARAILIRTALRDAGEPVQASAQDYEAAARLAERGQDRVIVSRAYLEAARVHGEVGDPVQGAADIEKALAAARLAGLDDDIDAMLLLAAELHQSAEDIPRALRRLQEALERFAAAGDLAGQARAMEQKGTLLLESERFPEAAATLTEAHRLAREAADGLTEGRAEGGLAALAMMAGRVQEAIRRYRRSGDLLEEAGDSFQALRMRSLADGIEARQPEGSGL